MKYKLNLYSRNPITVLEHESGVEKGYRIDFLWMAQLDSSAGKSMGYTSGATGSFGSVSVPIPQRKSECVEGAGEQ